MATREQGKVPWRSIHVGTAQSINQSRIRRGERYCPSSTGTVLVQGSSRLPKETRFRPSYPDMDANREEEEEEQEEEDGRDVDMARALLRTAWQDPGSRDWSIRKWAAEFRVGMEPQQRFDG
jgi:hypothetical protein